jgi:hypothetical protein
MDKSEVVKATGGGDGADWLVVLYNIYTAVVSIVHKLWLHMPMSVAEFNHM